MAAVLWCPAVMWCLARNTPRDVAAGNPAGSYKEPQHISRKRKRTRREECSPTGLQRARNRASPGGSPPAAQQAPARVSPSLTASLQPLPIQASAPAAGNTCQHPAAADGAGRAWPQGTVTQQPAECRAANAQRQETTTSQAALKARADQLQRTLVWCQQWLTCMGAASAARWCQLQQRHPDFTRAALADRQAHTALKEPRLLSGTHRYVAATKTC